MEIAGNIIILAGIAFIFMGIVGLFRFNNFFARILITAKIDTVGVITLIIGLALKHGFGFFSLKLILLLGIMLILNPLSAHIMANSAYLSGHRPNGAPNGNDDDGGNL